MNPGVNYQDSLKETGTKEFIIRIPGRKQESWNYLSGHLEGNKNHGTIYQENLKETGTLKLIIKIP